MFSVLRPEPDMSVRPWGGTRLGGASPAGPIGEAWVAGPATRVRAGQAGTSPGSSTPDPGGSVSLDELAALHGRAFVGSRSPWPDRFPLLVKLIDPVAWLSVQVHPDDRLARMLVGPDAVGKTEAWFVLEADLSTALLVGVRAGVTDAQVRAAIRDGGLASLLQRISPLPGDTVLLPAGTLHAVGPGLFLYEVQEPSDLTYRADDWGRPATPGRPLHVTETLAAWKPDVVAVFGHATPATDARSSRTVLVECEHFVLELVQARPDQPVALDTGGASPHVVTALPGTGITISGTTWRETLHPLETAVVSAGAGPYEVITEASRPAAALIARLPG